MSVMNEENKLKLAQLEKAERKEEVKETIDLATQLTVRDRLMRRLKSNTIQVPFKDDVGEFNIEVRMLSPEEQVEFLKYRRQLFQIRREMDNPPTTIDGIKELGERSDEVLKALYGMVAEICVDKRLDLEYWRSGRGFNADVPFALLNGSLSFTRQSEVDTVNFRRK